MVALWSDYSGSVSGQKSTFALKCPSYLGATPPTLKGPDCRNSGGKMTMFYSPTNFSSIATSYSAANKCLQLQNALHVLIWPLTSTSWWREASDHIQALIPETASRSNKLGPGDCHSVTQLVPYHHAPCPRWWYPLVSLSLLTSSTKIKVAETYNDLPSWAAVYASEDLSMQTPRERRAGEATLTFQQLPQLLLLLGNLI